MVKENSISIIGVPMDLGASRRGVDMGPSALRIAQVGERLRALGYSVSDQGNLSVRVRDVLPHGEANAKAHYLEEIVEVLTTLKNTVYECTKGGHRPLILGGDHSIAMGTVAGLSKAFQDKKQKLGLIWFDAHGDINTPDTTLSGNIHGMPVAHILGMGHKQLLGIADSLPMIDPSKVCLIGLRDLDPGERTLIKKTGVKAFTMREIDERGMRDVVLESIRTASDGTAGFHVSFDVDGVDPSFAPGVGTPVTGGITYREAHLAMELIADSTKMTSMEVTEVNPILDVSNQTANLAVEMVLSAFGKRIL
mgnify:CR=1 FL=1